MGGDARVTIALRNVSDHQICVCASSRVLDNPEFSYRIEVKERGGARAGSRLRMGVRRMQHQQSKRVGTVEYVQTGWKAALQTAHVDEAGEFKSGQGRYTVRVYRKDPKTGKVVRSNELTLNVVP